VIPEGADVGPDEAASTTNQADIRGLPEAEPHDRGSSGAASVLGARVVPVPGPGVA
jgi:hypothetical protein